MGLRKLIRDGKVGVIINKCFGSGWYTLHKQEQLLFDPIIINMIESKIENPQFKLYLSIQDYDHKHDLTDLQVVWLPEGTKFEVLEYDGYESIITELPLTA